MKKIKQIIAINSVLLLISIGAFAQSSASKTEKIETLMELTGSSKQYKEIMGVMINSLSKGTPNMPKGFLESFIKELDIEGLRSSMVPIYDKHFTETEIDGIIAFYQSEVGKKMIGEMPAIMGELMPIIQVKVKAMTERMKELMKQQQEKDKN